MSSSPAADDFVRLVDQLRERGAVRMSWGPYSVEFAAPALTAAEAKRAEELAQPLDREERIELNELRQLKHMSEELGHG